MACKGPGLSNRKRVSLIEFAQWFPDQAAVWKWFESVIWKDGLTCPGCGGSDIYGVNSNSKDAPVFTDEHSSYQKLSGHVSANHNSKEWTVSTALDHLAHINGMEFFRTTFKRAFHGTYHRISMKHLNRYVGKHNIQELDTIDQMASVIKDMVGKRLKYKDLIA